MTGYEATKAKYEALGVDTDRAIERLKKVPVSLHCWQLDDVIGFDNDGGLTGGIQTTGNYPGRARTPQQLMEDMEEAMKLMPGTAKLNIHASYAIFEPGEFADRDALEPKHFKKWVEFAKKHNMGIDFNPTFFSHEKVKDGLTLSSPDEETRNFWINHGKACIRISEYFAKETGVPCVMNIWTGDGFKDVPADRMGPRLRYKDSIEQILSEPYDRKLVKPCVESKVFGIGVESYTVGSAEFTLSFAAQHEGCMPLMDNGHYHPTEYVSDKIPAMLCFYPEFALHITRGVRWDSDHVLLLDDETKEMAKEIVRNDALDRVYMALDYYKKTQETSESDEILGQLDEYLNQEQGSNIGSLPGGNNNIINVPVNDVNPNNTTGGNTSSNKLTYKGYAVNGKIEIPRIDLEYPILEATVDTIMVAVGFIYGPGLNEVGNNVIIGHNFRDGRFFSNNDKLSIGDKIYITDLSNRRLEYKITKKYITDANDFSYAVRDTKGKREISLSTCTDDVSGRLVIWAEEI